jgi:hypothetical protein
VNRVKWYSSRAMSRARQVGSVLVMAGFLAFTTATSRPKKDGAIDGSADAAAPPPSSSTAANAPPADVDPSAISVTLGCSGRPGNAGCALLRDFDTADAWENLPVVETVWFGESHAIGGLADGKSELFYVQVNGGQLGFTGTAHTLLPDNAREAQDAFKLLAATRAGTTLPNSEALTFMKTPGDGKRTIVRTRGKSQAFAETPTQVFIRTKGDKLLILEHTGNFIAHETGKGPGSARAWVSELFRLR